MELAWTDEPEYKNPEKDFEQMTSEVNIPPLIWLLLTFLIGFLKKCWKSHCNEMIREF